MTKFKTQNRFQIQNPKLAVLCFVLCVWCFGFINNAYALDITNVKSNFLRGDYEAAINNGEKLMAEAGKESEQLDELYYILGLSYMKSGNLLRASDIFEIVINEFKDSRFREGAYIGLADIDFLKEDYKQAQTRYKELLDKSPHTKSASLLIYKLAQCALKQGDWPKAQEYLDRLNNEFPLSLEARISKGRATGEYYFTVQVGSFSSYTNANNVVRKLKDKGYDAYVEESQSDAKKLYRVRVGKLSSRVETKALEDKLAADGFSTKVFP